MTNEASFTWVCAGCRKSYRRPKAIRSFACPRCHSDCRRIHWSVAIPSPGHERRWRAFAKRSLQTITVRQHYADILAATFPVRPDRLNRRFSERPERR